MTQEKSSIETLEDYKYWKLNTNLLDHDPELRQKYKHFEKQVILEKAEEVKKNKTMKKF